MAKLDPAIMAQFTGSEEWYKHGLVNIVYTEGAKYVADTAEAYWLLDEIALGQMIPEIRAEEFQVWKLKVNEEKHTARLIVEDGNDNVVYTKRIEYTDFPGDGINLWFTNNTIFLPSEY